MSKKLQIFISSTYTDLLDERQAAVGAVLKAGHIPAGMELFSAGDRSQLQTIRSWIEQSDVYMLILGGRYGSIESESGLSYTELEFDYAVELGKPLFAVVISDNGLDNKLKSGGAAFIEKENSKLLVNFKAKVLSNITSFFDEPKDIRLAVHESLAEFSKNKNLVGWVQGNQVVDTQPMFEEIKKLSDENTTLRARLTELQRREEKTDAKKSDFTDLLKLLISTRVTIPAEHTRAKKAQEASLLYLFNTRHGDFASGIYNKIDMSETERFLFFTVGEKLATFGLVDYEKVTGVHYRRCYLTNKGKSFISEYALLKINESDPDLPEVSESIPASQITYAPSNASENAKPVTKKKTVRKKTLAGVQT